MLIIDGNNISLSRANTAILDVEIVKDGEVYTLQSGDSIELSVKRKCDFTNTVLSKISTSNTIIINPSDTANMGLGEYVYGITFTGQGIVDTFITGEFNILCGVME